MVDRKRSLSSKRYTNKSASCWTETLIGSSSRPTHQLTTINGYRSSITRTLAISGGTDFSNNEFFSLLIRNVDLERPKQKRLVPQWGLGLVLSALKLPQFESLELELDLLCLLLFKYIFNILIEHSR
jgi:hypothetical protein